VRVINVDETIHEVSQRGVEREERWRDDFEGKWVRAGKFDSCCGGVLSGAKENQATNK
jgi:hypothetical protein